MQMHPGKVKKTTVTEWLKNTEKGSVDDETVLEDVENVKGNEKYKEGSDDSIVWEQKEKTFIIRELQTKSFR